MAEDNRLISSFSKGITALNVKTSSFLEVNKINTHISTVAAEIKELKFEIGETACAKWKENEDFTESITKLCASIKEKEELIAELNIQKQNIEERDKQILGKKDKPAAAQAMGSAQPEPPPENAFICPNCNAAFAEKINFCKKCGQKME